MNVNNFAVMQFNGKPLLCKVEEGYFASSAWLISQEAFKNISGESFGIIAGDDCCNYRERKYEFHLPTEDEVKTLFSECCQEFKDRYYHLVFEDEYNESQLNALENQSVEC